MLCTAHFVPGIVASKWVLKRKYVSLKTGVYYSEGLTFFAGISIYFWSCYCYCYGWIDAGSRGKPVDTWQFYGMLLNCDDILSIQKYPFQWKESLGIAEYFDRKHPLTLRHTVGSTFILHHALSAIIHRPFCPSFGSSFYLCAATSIRFVPASSTRRGRRILERLPRSKPEAQGYLNWY